MSVTTLPVVEAAAHDAEKCKIANDMLARVSEKWSMRVVLFLSTQSRRFSDIERGINGISQRMLTRTLRNLERDGLVTRTVTHTRPPRVDYELTEIGFSLKLSLSALGGWVQENEAAVRAARAAFDGRTRS